MAKSRWNLGWSGWGKYCEGHRPGLHQPGGILPRLLLQGTEGPGPDAPIGQLNYVIEGVMIGGFALVVAPAEYRITGVQTFIVSNDGVVYQRDFGPTTLDEFKKMEFFNPSKSWTPLPEEDN